MVNHDSAGDGFAGGSHPKGKTKTASVSAGGRCQSGATALAVRQ